MASCESAGILVGGWRGVLGWIVGCVGCAGGGVVVGGVLAVWVSHSISCGGIARCGAVVYF